MPARSFWPCTHVPLETTHSIVLGASQLHLLAHHFGGREAGGYAIERLAKRLARAHDPKLLRRLSFDSEASMFCAIGAELDALHTLAKLLAKATGTTEAATRLPTATAPPRSHEDEEAARQALLAGFALGEDPDARRRFLTIVREPPRSDDHARSEADLTGPDRAKRIQAAGRLQRQADSTTWSFASAVGDPRFVDRLLAALAVRGARGDEEELVALLRLTVAVCGRHLADLRFGEPCTALVTHPSAEVRLLAIRAVATLFRWSWDALAQAFDDRAPTVRVEIARATTAAEEAIEPPVASDFARYERPEDLPETVYARLVALLEDPNAAVRASAAGAIGHLGKPDAEALLRARAKREKVAQTRQALARALDLASYDAPYRPARIVNGVLELTRFRGLAPKAGPIPDGAAIERALRARHPKLLERVETSSRTGYFAAWGKTGFDEKALGDVAAAIRRIGGRRGGPSSGR